MRSSALVAALALLGALVAATLLPAAVAAKPCPKGTTAVGPGKTPAACVGAVPSTPLVALEQAATKARANYAKGRGKRPGKGNARATKLMGQVFAFAQERVAAGEPILLAEPRASKAARARAGGNAIVTNAPAALGKQVSTTVDSNGNVRTEFRTSDLSVTLEAQKGEFSMDIRDKQGAGGFLRAGSFGSDIPRCPSPAGDVPSEFDSDLTFGLATAEHGVRTVVAITMKFDGPWHGYVGVGGKAERFDMTMRGAMEVRLNTEIAATGKVLQREPTRTYRSVLERKGVPIGTDGRSLLGGTRMFGPKGAISSAIDRTLSATLASLLPVQIDAVSGLLKIGDTRWYEQRLCARTSLESSRPEQVTKGATASWQVRVTDVVGATVADAQWTVSSSCGELSTETTRGPTMRASVVDADRTWGPDPYAPGCIKAEVTSTAGRAAVFTDTIEPKKPDGLRFSVGVTYNETMGSGIAETNMTALGTVFLPWNAEDAEGTGTYQGTEWDATPANPCGWDMGRSRGFSGKATVGVHRNDDDTFTVLFTANERPLRMSFLAIVPAQGGLSDTTGTQPFCGEPKGSKTSTKMTISTMAVPAGE